LRGIHCNIRVQITLRTVVDIIQQANGVKAFSVPSRIPFLCCREGIEVRGA
jgi:hypothetical protein